AFDECGNESSYEYSVSVVDTFTQRIVCVKPLLAIGDDGTVTIAADEIVAAQGSFCDTSMHTFTAEFQFPGGNQKAITYSCSDFPDPSGLVDTVNIIIFDNGDTIDFCRTLIEVRDPNNFCPDSLLQIESNILTEENQDVNGYMMMIEDLKSSEYKEMNQSKFTIPSGGSYLFAPMKDNFHDEGVSALDMVLIQRHILRLDVLKSPYKMIAADVNNDERINISDLIQMRKLLLGVYDRFPDNSSWKNIDASYQFFNVETALHELYRTYISVENADHNMRLDFVGVKIGDVNGSYVSAQQGVTPRSTIQIITQDAILEQGQVVEIPVFLSRSMRL